MIDPKLQAELRERFNPDGSDLRKMQLRMLEMLKYIDKMCRENNIRYWLSSGTCLGAVRHGGFIPWDDDVDIEMLKKDYNRLRKCVLADKNCPYIWQDQFTDLGYHYQFAKLRDRKSLIKEVVDFDQGYKYRGIFIDIFILTPSNSKHLRQISTTIINRLYGGIYRTRSEYLIRLCKKLNYHILSPILQLLQSFNAKGRLRHIIGVNFTKERYNKDVRETKLIPFEDTLLYVPYNCDNYLRTIYGDYNRLPKIEDIPSHTISVKID